VSLNFQALSTCILEKNLPAFFKDLAMGQDRIAADAINEYLAKKKKAGKTKRSNRYRHPTNKNR